MTKDKPKKKSKEQEYLEGWKRAKADFINYKKEEAERVSGAITSIKKSILQDLILVLDSFDLGEMMSKSEMIDKKGVKLIRNQFYEVLKKFGLQKINVESGEDFNPHKHEAISETESEIEEGKIVEELETGYILEDKVVRPSKVVVSKGRTKINK